MAFTQGSILPEEESPRPSGGVYLVSGGGKILRLPVPSDSPRDPLTWKLSKRLWAFVALEIYASVAHFEILLGGVLKKPVQNEFGTGPSGPVEVEGLTAVMNLVTGLGYLVSVPLSTAIGRKPVLIGSAILTCVASLWAGVCGSFQQLLTAIAFQSLAAGAAITMTTLILIDATFIHERPNVLSLHWSINGVLSKIGLIVLPFVMDINTKWRPIYLIWFPLAAVSLLLIVVLLPETFFLRPPVAVDGCVLIQTASEKVFVYKKSDYSGPNDPKESSFIGSEPSKKTISSGSPVSDWKAISATCMQMLLCLINPLIFWIALLTGVHLSGVVFLIYTQFSALLQQGVDGPNKISSLIGVAGIIGSILAFPVTGPFMSWSTRFQAFRKGTLRHAEVYLWSFSIPVVSGSLSVLISGLAIQNSWPPGIVYLSSGLNIFSYVTSNVAFTLWLTEAFPAWTAAALTVQLLVGNLVSFGIATGAMTSLETGSVLIPSVIISSLILVLGLVIVPVVFWGKDISQVIQGRWSAFERGALRPQ